MNQLYLIGTGPGGLEHLSPAARTALESCTDLAGHGLYLNLLGALTEGKTRHKTPMGEELARATLALDLAASGRTTALPKAGIDLAQAVAQVGRSGSAASNGRRASRFSI